MKTKRSTTKAQVQPRTLEFVRSLRGSLKGEPSALKILLKERKRGRNL